MIRPASSSENGSRRAAPEDWEVFDVADFWRAVVRRRWLILTVTTVTLGIAAAITFRIEPLYEGTTAMRFEDPNGAVNLSVPALAAVDLPGVTGLMSDIEMLSSRTLAAAVLDSLVPRLGRSGDQEALDRLQGALRISRRRRDANIVDVRYRDHDPSLARDVPNTLVAIFMQDRQAQRQIQARSTAEFLRRRIAEIGMQLASAERSLEGFRESANIVDIPEQARTSVQEAAQLKAQYNALSAEQGALADLIARARAQHDAGGGSNAYRTLMAFPALLRSPAASEMMSALSNMDARRTELLTRRSEKDPDVVLLTNQIRAVENNMLALTTSYERSLSRQLASLDSMMSGARRELAALPARQLSAARLERDERLLESTYIQLQGRLHEAELAASVEDGSVRVLDAALLPDQPVIPRPLRYLSAALFAGLLLSLALVLILESADRSLRTRREIAHVTGLPVLASIPHVAPRHLDRLLANTSHEPGHNRLTQTGWSKLSSRIEHDRPVVTEAYNRLRTNLAFTRPHAVLRTIVITSARPGEGKTATALNLAVALARHGQHVLLVDADMRRGRIADLLDITNDPGLANVLQENTPHADAIRTVRVADDVAIDVMPAGLNPSDPARLLASEELHTMLEALRQSYETIILDAPPLSVVTDAALLGAQADGVALVVRSGMTTEAMLSDTLADLEVVGARPLGVILTDSEDPAEAYYYYSK